MSVARAGQRACACQCPAHAHNGVKDTAKRRLAAPASWRDWGSRNFAAAASSTGWQTEQDLMKRICQYVQGQCLPANVISCINTIKQVQGQLYTSGTAVDLHIDYQGTFSRLVFWSPCYTVLAQSTIAGMRFDRLKCQLLPGRTAHLVRLPARQYGAVTAEIF